MKQQVDNPFRFSPAEIAAADMFTAQIDLMNTDLTTKTQSFLADWSATKNTDDFTADTAMSAAHYFTRTATAALAGLTEVSTHKASQTMWNAATKWETTITGSPIAETFTPQIDNLKQLAYFGDVDETGLAERTFLEETILIDETMMLATDIQTFSDASAGFDHYQQPEHSSPIVKMKQRCKQLLHKATILGNQPNSFEAFNTVTWGITESMKTLANCQTTEKRKTNEQTRH